MCTTGEAAAGRRIDDFAAIDGRRNAVVRSSPSPPRSAASLLGTQHRLDAGIEEVYLTWAVMRTDRWKAPSMKLDLPMGTWLLGQGQARMCL